MAIEWKKVNEDVLKMAQRLIDEYHPDLASASIGFLFRDPTPRNRGKITAGKAIKVADSVKEVMDEPVDFIIWLAWDIWHGLSVTGQLGLLDHELQHCTYDEEFRPQLRGHDIEEFFMIVARHGSYRDEIMAMDKIIEKAKQDRLFELPDNLGANLVTLARAEAPGKRPDGKSQATIQAFRNGEPTGPRVDMDTGEIVAER